MDRHAHDEGAARDRLTVGAVADVEFERVLEEAVAHCTAGTASFTRKVRRLRHGRDPRMVGPAGYGLAILLQIEQCDLGRRGERVTGVHTD